MSKYIQPQPAILILEDGKTFFGNAIGFKGTTTGEICFNTGMSGYQEIFTDPSYFGQVVTMTNTHIGNYGITNQEVESKDVKIAGLVVKNFSVNFSRKLATDSLQNYLAENRIVGISNIDTRSLVKYIRNRGAMNCIISSEEFDVELLKEKLSKVPSMKGLELSSKVSTNQNYFYGNPNASYKVAAIDFGIKENILRCLAERDCYVKVFPMNTEISEIKSWNPHGYFISNGPGDPAAMPNTVKLVKEILDLSMPLFGICLGHQLLAEAIGIGTYKMHNGHRGINHPIKNLLTGLDEVTSQNHGFAVEKEKLENNEIAEMTHIHLNDGTVAGLRLKNQPAFSVQYHPESSPGPHDSRYLFDDFIKMIKNHHNI